MSNTHYETPFPFEVTVEWPDSEDTRQIVSSPHGTEWLTETEQGDVLQQATDRAAIQYDTEGPVRIRFDADRWGENVRFDVLGRVEDDETAIQE